MDVVSGVVSTPCEPLLFRRRSSVSEMREVACGGPALPLTSH